MLSRTVAGIRRVLYMLVLGMLTGMPAQAQAQESPEEVLRAIQQAFARGDAEALARHTESRVDVSLLGVQTLYSRAQTEYVMRAFFREHPAEQFVLQRTTEENGAWMATGRYWNRSDAQPYRVTLLLRKRDGAVLIRSIRIDLLRS